MIQDNKLLINSQQYNKIKDKVLSKQEIAYDADNYAFLVGDGKSNVSELENLHDCQFQENIPLKNMKITSINRGENIILNTKCSTEVIINGEQKKVMDTYKYLPDLPSFKVNNNEFTIQDIQQQLPTGYAIQIFNKEVLSGLKFVIDNDYNRWLFKEFIDINNGNHETTKIFPKMNKDKQSINVAAKNLQSLHWGGDWLTLKQGFICGVCSTTTVGGVEKRQHVLAFSYASLDSQYNQLDKQEQVIDLLINKYGHDGNIYVLYRADDATDTASIDTDIPELWQKDKFLSNLDYKVDSIEFTNISVDDEDSKISFTGKYGQVEQPVIEE